MKALFFLHVLLLSSSLGIAQADDVSCPIETEDPPATATSDSSATSLDDMFEDSYWVSYLFTAVDLYLAQSEVALSEGHATFESFFASPEVQAVDLGLFVPWLHSSFPLDAANLTVMFDYWRSKSAYALMEQADNATHAEAPIEAPTEDAQVLPDGYDDLSWYLQENGLFWEEAGGWAFSGWDGWYPDTPEEGTSAEPAPAEPPSIPTEIATTEPPPESAVVSEGIEWNDIDTWLSSTAGYWPEENSIEEIDASIPYWMGEPDPLIQINVLGLAATELHHVIPEWLARYSVYGTRNQGFAIRLTTDFHRLTTGFNLENQLTQIRNQLRAGSISERQAYNQVLMVHLRNLPAIIRNNRAAVGISSGSAWVFRGSIQAALAQAQYFTATEAALGLTGAGTMAIGGYYLADKWVELVEYDNYNLVAQAEIDLYNTQVKIASRMAQFDGGVILSAVKGFVVCPEDAESPCARKFQAALNRNYFFIQTMGVEQFGISAKQARDIVSEGLFIDYLQCVGAAGCLVQSCE